MISEAGHYTTFIKLAKKFFPEKEVDDRWKAFLEFEASVIANYGKKETIHG
jgi:tRNA-(ms[2]io[6]A)-hydroxylase